MSSIDDLIETAEILRDAVLAKDKDKGFEAVTVFFSYAVHGRIWKFSKYGYQNVPRC